MTMRTKWMIRALLLVLLLASWAVEGASPGVDLKLIGPWAIEVHFDAGRTQVVNVPPPQWVDVKDEKHTGLPLFNARAGGWLKGVQLRGVRAQETTTPYLLDPASLRVKGSEEANAATFEKGKDFDADLQWGTIGRLPDGRIKEGQAVFVDYRYGRLRLDSIVRRKNGRLELRAGEPRAAAPHPPNLTANEARLANIWVPGVITNLTANNLFPIFETAYPEPAKSVPTRAEVLLSKSLAKLRSGERLRILAW